MTLVNHIYIYSVTKQSGVKSKLPGPPLSDVVVLDTHNFDQIALVCLFDLLNMCVDCSLFFTLLHIRIPLKMFW